MTEPPVWTKATLVEHVKQLGYPFKVRTLDLWIGQGLVGSPTLRPKGRGSDKAIFSSNQARLFVELVRLHDAGTRAAVLANVPVWLWIQWGDEYVATPQARKALRTWAGFGASASMAKVRATVRPLLPTLGAPTTTKAEREQLTDVLAALVASPTTNLTSLLPTILDALANIGADDESAKTYALVLEARLLGVRVFRQGHDEQLWDDQTLSQIRIEHAASIGEHLAAGGEIPAVEQLQSACLAFVTFVGFSQRQALR